VRRLLVEKSTSAFKVVKREVAVLKAMEGKFSLILPQQQAGEWSPRVLPQAPILRHGDASKTERRKASVPRKGFVDSDTEIVGRRFVIPVGLGSFRCLGLPYWFCLLPKVLHRQCKGGTQTARPAREGSPCSALAVARR
jgi:hypothetical protein